VVGEELAWRSYALPRLQARFGAVGAGLILGILWAAWHLPNQFIPGLEFYGYGFGAFALYVVAMTVLFHLASQPDPQ
jgi:membrane protease YdiL (CAAX protease family)